MNLQPSLLLFLTGLSCLLQFTSGSQGLFPDPDNCQNFFRCERSDTGYHTFRRSCPPPLLFNNFYLYCDFGYKVDCGDRPLPAGNAYQIISGDTNLLQHWQLLMAPNATTYRLPEVPYPQHGTSYLEVQQELCPALLKKWRNVVQADIFGITNKFYLKCWVPNSF